MPVNREFTIYLDDHSSALVRVSQALADRGISILAFQSSSAEGTARRALRLVVDNPTAAKAALEAERLTYTEASVAQIRVAHRPGQLARAASWLSDATINIDHLYCGVEPRTNFPLLIFGVADADRVVRILEETSPAGAGA